MLDPRTLIPSNIIAFVGSITGSKDILDLSENERFALKYLPNDGLVGQGKSTVALPEGLHPPIYVHQFGEHMFNPGGWIYGSSDNTDICDFQIVEGNQTGVSRRHFKLDIDPATRWPRITNLSNNVVTLQPSADARHVTLRRSQSLEIKDSVIIHAAGHQVRLCRPDHSPKCRNEYTRKAERYSADFLQALPKLLSGSSTAVVRYGPGDTVYVNEGGPQSSGSFATVVKVREQTSRMVFAAKIPHYNVRDPAGEARNRWESMVGEFTRMSSLQHSCVVEVITILTGSTELEPPWMIMEWIPATLRSRRPEASDASRVFSDISRGLAYIHSKGYTHRDLKPANILITSDGGAKIADFGMAKNDVTDMHTWAGTSIYMAPEFWAPDVSYTQAVDCWSLGIIMVQWIIDDDTRLKTWDQISVPTRNRHRVWVVKTLWPCINGAQGDSTKDMLQGMLKFEVKSRWTAAQCEEWHQRYDIATGAPIGKDGRDVGWG